MHFITRMTKPTAFQNYLSRHSEYILFVYRSLRVYSSLSLHEFIHKQMISFFHWISDSGRRRAQNHGIYSLFEGTAKLWSQFTALSVRFGCRFNNAWTVYTWTEFRIVTWRGTLHLRQMLFFYLHYMTNCNVDDRDEIKNTVTHSQL